MSTERHVPAASGYARPQVGSPASPTSNRAATEPFRIFLPETESSARAQVTWRDVGIALPETRDVTLGALVRQQVCLLDAAVRDRLASERRALHGRDDRVDEALATAYGLEVRPGDATVSQRLVRDEVADDTRQRPELGHRWLFEPGLAGVPRSAAGSDDGQHVEEDYATGTVPLTGILIRRDAPTRILPDVDRRPVLEMAQEGLTSGSLVLMPACAGHFVSTRVPAQDEEVELSLFVSEQVDAVAFIRLARNAAVRYLRSRTGPEQQERLPDTLSTDALKVSLPDTSDEHGFDARGRTLETLFEQLPAAARSGRVQVGAEDALADRVRRAMASASEPKWFDLRFESAAAVVRCLPANLEVA